MAGAQSIATRERRSVSGKSEGQLHWAWAQAAGLRDIDLRPSRLRQRARPYASIVRCPLEESIAILRGFAFSATGTSKASTPSW